jgi:hypothetical protein
MSEASQPFISCAESFLGHDTRLEEMAVLALEEAKESLFARIA